MSTPTAILVRTLVTLATVAIFGIVLNFTNRYSSTEKVSIEATHGRDLQKSAVLYFPYFKSIKKFDPHFLAGASAASLSQNLYSRVVSLTNDGQITEDLADDIRWDGKSYRLHIRKGTKTVDGFPIEAKDVAISLVRNFRRRQNTHGNLNMLMDEEGIQVENDTVILTPRDPRFKTFLITLLASSDFAIIPSISLDLDKIDLPIRDWRNSSGLYYVDNDSESGAFTLRINKNHHFFNGRQVEMLKLHPGIGYDAIELFNKGIVDIIPTATVADSGDFLEVDTAVANVHRTENIHFTSLFFTSRGLKKFSPYERLKIGDTIKRALLKRLKPGAWSPTEEYLPKFGEGSLSREQLTALRSLVDRARNTRLKKTAVFGVYPSRLEYFRSALKGELGIQVEPTKGRPPWLEPESRQPDLYFSMGDSMFFESLSLLHYNFEQGTFLNRADGILWLQSYIEVDTKSERIALIKALHFQALIAGRIIPVLTEPYFSVSRKPLTANFSKFYAGSPFWNLIVN